MSGWTSELQGFEFMRNGNTLFMMKNEPLSYEPAGSSVVTLSVVPTVMVPEAPLSPGSFPAAQPLSTMAAMAVPPSTVSVRFRIVDADVISGYLSLL